MKLSGTVPLILFAGLGLPAAAQSVADGFYTKGFVELEYFNGSGSSEILGFANVDFGIAPSAGGLGFDIGVEALSLNSDDQVALYGALSYSGDFGKVQIGVPRPVIDDYLAVPSLGGLEYFDVLVLSGHDGSLLSRAYLLSDIDTPLGLRYDGTFGNATVGASYHSVEGADIVNVATNYRLGETTLRGGLEHLRGGASSGTSFFLGADAQFGKVNAGVLYSHLGAAGDSDALQLYAKFKPIDQLELTANVAAVDSGGSDDTVYGLSADYNFNQGVYLQAGIADANSADSIYNLSLGLKF